MLMGFSAMKMVPISTYGILMNLKAILVILISHFYLSDKMTIKRLILVIVSFMGAFMIVKPNLMNDLSNWVTGNKSDATNTINHIPDIYSIIIFFLLITRKYLLSWMYSNKWQFID